MLPPIRLNTYGALRDAVSEVLVSGRRKLETLKVRIYWQTGKLISDYLKLHPDEDTKDTHVVHRLARDLEYERSLFYRLLQFAEAFPNVVPGRQLTWTHYRALIVLPDGGQRRLLAREAEQAAWPVRRLRKEILRRRGLSRKAKPTKTSETLQEPPRGRFGVRRIKEIETVDGARQNVIDFGFEIYSTLSRKDSARFRPGELVVWSTQKEAWIRGGVPEDVYFYEGEVERVVDGDTILVYVALGFDIRRRQYLRLRGIDTPELGSVAGRRARDFVLKYFKDSAQVTFKSRFTDRYDRYLSDVWVGNTYVNQALLDRGLAVRV